MIPFPSLHRLWPMAGLALSALALTAQAQKTPAPKPASPSGTYPALSGAPGEQENEKEDQRKRAAWRLLSLTGGKDKTYNPQDLVRAKNQIQRMSKTSAALPAPTGAVGTLAAGVQPSGWTNIGPGNIGGRTRTIVTHPTDPNTLYAGAVGGGVWKTTNGGALWNPLHDFMASIAVTTMVMDPTNPGILYAGTGEGYPGDGLRGAGVFKTTDAGATWTQLASTANSTFHFINRLAIHPTHPGTLLMASQGGLHRSTDGGATWTQVVWQGVCDDVDFHPTNGSLAVATCWGMASQSQYSTDGGVTWTASNTLPPGRTEIAYARSNPSILYASVDYGPDGSWSRGYLYRSQDGGRTWTLRNTDLFLSGQGWYDNALWVDPIDPQVVMVGGVGMYYSTDGGQNLIGVWLQPLHADQHVIVSASNYSATNRRVYVGNDGGIYSSPNVLDLFGAGAWVSLNNNYAVTQFYGGNAHPTVDFVMGGTQDNGTPRYAGNRNDWVDITWADGGMVAVDPRVSPTGTTTWYGEIQNGGIWRMKFNSAGENLEHMYLGGSHSEWGYAPWVAPIVLDPNDPERLYQGRQRLWRLADPDGDNPWERWAPVSPDEFDFVTAIAVAKGNADKIWIGTTDGNLRYTTNGLAANPTWVERSVPARTGYFVTRVTVDPANHDVVYATFGGFFSDNVWRSDNAGLTWTDITGNNANGVGNLPDVPVRSLVIHPQNSDWIYVGTEAGVFASENRGGTWSTTNDGPTNASVDELFFVNNTLYSATHGRGMWRIPVEISAPRIQLPGRIQAEDYKAGGQGVGYNDLTAGNTGGVYKTDAVDIEATTDAGGGHNVGWIQAGEWLAYDVNVTTTRAYSLTARMASAATGTRTLVLSVDGANVATFNLTPTGGWQTWTNVTVNNVNLTAGNHVVRLTMTNGDFNVNWVDVTAPANQAPTAHAGPDQTVNVNTVVTLDGRGSTDPESQPLTYAWTQVSGPSVTLTGANTAQPTFNAGQAGTYVFRLVVNDGAAASAPDEVSITAQSGIQYLDLPGRFQAEAYRPGGANVGYRDLTAGNLGGAGGRNDDVDQEATTDAGGGFNVGWIDAGEWLAYDVRVATTGAYRITARVASGSAGTKTLRMLVDGVQVATFSFTDASGWQSWRDVTVTGVNLTSGVHLLTLEASTAGFNLNWVDVAAGGNLAPTAHAGPDQAVNVNALVTLDGRGSADPDNGPSALTYAWTQVSGPTATLSGAATARPTFTPASAGTYVFRLVVGDGAASSSPDEVSITAQSGIQYIDLPGRFQAEAYRPGGANVGYRDLSAGNLGGAGTRADDVDLENTADAGGGLNVGYIDATEWLAYDVRVAATGRHTLTARVASASAGTKTLRMLVDGVQVATFSFTDASGWQSWRDVTVTGVNLTAGTHLLTLEMATGGFNLNYVQVTAEASGIPLPGRIQAEDFKAGGQGVGYSDLSAGNTGGAYRPTENVDIEATTDAGGGFNVGWVQATEWLAYDVNVAATRTYTLKARMASQAAGTKTVVMSVDGVNVATFNLTAATGWQVWNDVTVTGVSLTAGAHVVRFTASTGDFNLNYVDVQ